MKKSYFLMVAAATMFAACSQSDVLNEVQVQEEAQAIGFSTYSNKATRASSSADLETYHATFGVWAYKTYEGVETNVMPNYVVAYNDAGNGSKDWDYDGTTGAAAGQVLKYWDKRASYQFFAYAPHNSDNVSIDATSKVISIKDGQYAANENIQTAWGAQNNGVFTGTGLSAAYKSTDWMIATPVTKAAGVNELVEEQFSHTMSKLIVCLKTTDTFAETITVNSVAVNNVHGSGKYSSDATGWTTTGSVKTINGQVGDIVAGDTFYSMEYLVIPSTDAPNFSVNYTINGDTYDVKSQAIAGITEFAPGTVYTLTVTISAEPIHFEATVADWTVGPAGSVTIQ